MVKSQTVWSVINFYYVEFDALFGAIAGSRREKTKMDINGNLSEIHFLTQDNMSQLQMEKVLPAYCHFNGTAIKIFFFFFGGGGLLFFSFTLSLL